MDLSDDSANLGRNCACAIKNLLFGIKGQMHNQATNQKPTISCRCMLSRGKSIMGEVLLKVYKI